MKKFLAALLAAALSLSLAACGGNTDAPAASESSMASSSAPASSASAAPANLENAEFTPEQQAAAQKFLDLATRYDSVAEKVNADPNLAQMQEVVETMNGISDAMIEADAVFADPANLTADTLADLDIAVTNTNLFLDEVEAMLANYGGKQTVTVPVEIVNETGVDLYTLAMSPSNDENWGGNLLDSPLTTGTSGVTQMTFTEDSLVWDLMAGDSEGTALTFMGLDFAEVPMENAKLTLSVTEAGEYLASFAA